MMSMKRYRILIPLFLVGFFELGVVRAEEPKSVVLKAMIVNPSTDQSQKVPVELPLPREAGKKHVIGLTEGLKVVYDSEQGVYKAVGEVVLETGVQKMVEIQIEDIWRIPEQEIEFKKG